MDSVSIEPVVSILRYHPIGGFGDPWTFSCTLIKTADEITIDAATADKFTPTIRRAINRALFEQGITKVRYLRIKNGKKRLVTILVKQ